MLLLLLLLLLLLVSLMLYHHRGDFEQRERDRVRWQFALLVVRLVCFKEDMGVGAGGESNHLFEGPVDVGQSNKVESIRYRRKVAQVHRDVLPCRNQGDSLRDGRRAKACGCGASVAEWLAHCDGDCLGLGATCRCCCRFFWEVTCKGNVKSVAGGNFVHNRRWYDWRFAQGQTWSWCRWPKKCLGPRT